MSIFKIILKVACLLAVFTSCQIAFAASSDCSSSFTSRLTSFTSRLKRLRSQQQAELAAKAKLTPIVRAIVHDVEKRGQGMKVGKHIPTLLAAAHDIKREHGIKFDELIPILFAIERDIRYEKELRSNWRMKLWKTYSPGQQQRILNHRLSRAVVKRDKEQIKTYLNVGADPYAVGKTGYSAIGWARKIERPDIVELLKNNLNSYFRQIFSQLERR